MSTETAENQSEPGSMDAFVAAITEPVEETPSPEAANAAEAPQGEHQETDEVAAEPVEEAEGVEAADEPVDPDADQEDETPLYTVKINGVESQVPIDDLIAGFQKSGNYDQKMAEFSEQREAAKAERARINELRTALEAKLTEISSTAPEEPDWVKLASEDPLGWVEAKAKWEADSAAHAKAKQEAEFLANQRQHEQAVAGAKALAVAANLKTEDDMKAFSAEVKAVTDLHGFDEAELAQSTDHRILLMARDAVRYRKQQSAKPADKRVPQRPKAIKPGAAPAAGAAKADETAAVRAKLRKTGSLDDFAALLMIPES